MVHTARAEGSALQGLRGRRLAKTAAVVATTGMAAVLCHSASGRPPKAPNLLQNSRRGAAQGLGAGLG